MKRRTFLGALGALVGGMVLDPERALWVPGQKKIFDLGQHAPLLGERFRIVFSDGTEYAFNGILRQVWSESVTDGQLITDISITPVGPVNISSRALLIREEQSVAMAAQPSRFFVEGEPFGKVVEIAVPTLERSVIEVGDRSVPGLQRLGNINISGHFSSEALEGLVKKEFKL